MGLLTSLRLEGELEEYKVKIEAMSVHARMDDCVALGQSEGMDLPRLYAMTAGFITLIGYRPVTGEAIQ